jgi:ATPase subunit of ABC transporter with duplicated ATPase domains
VYGPTGANYGEVVQQLAERALRAADASTSSSSSSRRHHHMIGIAGAPGSGKTTLAQLVAERINTMVEQRGSGRPAVVVPMDGFHYYRWQLDQMPHPEVSTWYSNIPDARAAPVPSRRRRQACSWLRTGLCALYAQRPAEVQADQ